MFEKFLKCLAFQQLMSAIDVLFILSPSEFDGLYDDIEILLCDDCIGSYVLKKL